jgi:hypothetical protein
MSSPNPRGRPVGTKGPGRVVAWDLRQAARSFAEEALTFMVQCMRDENLDKDTRLKAAALIHDRGYGRPQMVVDAEVAHRFVVAPNTMELGEWLERKGQVQPSRWLEAQRPASRAQRPRDDASSARATLELKPNDIPETEAAAPSAHRGNGTEADTSPAGHGPAIERRKLN